MGKSAGITAPTGANEVDYSGVTFRSRLEARWALLFDLAGWDWEYEPCNYRVGVKMTYQPDFYLPDRRLWVEVKGDYWLNNRSLSKIVAAAAGPKQIPLRSEPYGPARRILIAGEIVPPTTTRAPQHALIYDVGGLSRNMAKHEASVANVFITNLGKDHLEPWLGFDASGIPKVGDTDKALAKRLCKPPLAEGKLPDRLANSYIVASATKGTGRSLGLDSTVKRLVSNRRGGRRTR